MDIARRELLQGILVALLGAGWCASAAQQQKAPPATARGRRGWYGGRRRRRGLRDPFHGVKIGTTGRVIRIGETNPRIKDPIGGNEAQIKTLHDQAFGSGSTSQTSVMSDRLAEMLFDRWKQSSTNAATGVQP